MVSILSLTEDISLSHIGPFFLSRRIFLSLTAEHRRTEHTNVHRDIKSTDYTEHYSHRGLTPSPSPNGEGSDYRDTPTCPPDV